MFGFEIIGYVFKMKLDHALKENFQFILEA